MGVVVNVDTGALRQSVPGPVLTICRRLHESGHAAWVVGGCVRDQLLSALYPNQPRRPGDWDIATSALPQVVQKLFPKVIPTGLEHGTVTVLIDRVPFEVTTFRAEAGYVDGRRPGQVIFLDDITADLSRRDFTVNAIAYDPLTDCIADPYAGIADLSASIIRAVGEPGERFAEDGLRVLRAARFVSTLEFRLDEATAAAIRPSLNSYRKVSSERVRDEWFKALKTRRPSLAFQVMATHGLLEVTAPELAAYTTSEIWGSVLAWVDACPERPDIRLAALLSPLVTDNGGPEGTPPRGSVAERAVRLVEPLLTRLRLSNEDRSRVVRLLTHHQLPPRGTPAPELRRWLRRIGLDLLEDLLALASCQSNKPEQWQEDVAQLSHDLGLLLRDKPAMSVKDLALDGKALMTELGLTPGKQLGLLLQQLLEDVTDAPELNAKPLLIERAKLHLQNAG